jgi:hypothetical protein
VRVMTTEHKHEWVLIPGAEFICNVTGCGLRCAAAPVVELERARADLKTMAAYSDLSRVLRDGEIDMTKLASSVADRLGACEGADRAHVFVWREHDGAYGASAYAPGVPIEVIMCQVLEALVLTRRALQAQKGGLLG